MKTLLEHHRSMIAALVIVLASLLSTSVASAKITTTLLSQDFSSEGIPPDGWTSNNYW